MQLEDFVLEEIIAVSKGSLTDQDAPETGMLLYQLMVFWSLKLDKTDIDGVFNFQNDTL